MVVILQFVFNSFDSIADYAIFSVWVCVVEAAYKMNDFWKWTTDLNEYFMIRDNM